MIKHLLFSFFLLFVVVSSDDQDTDDELKKIYEISYFFSSNGDIKKTTLSNVMEHIHEFADLSYIEIETLLNKLIPTIATNTELRFATKKESNSFDYADHMKMRDDVKEVAKFHSQFLSILPDEIIYYTMKFVDEEDKGRVFEIIKSIFEQNRKDYMQGIASHWETFRHLSSLRLPYENTEIMKYLGLLEAYVMLGDRLEYINDDENIQSAISQTSIATNMYDTIYRIRKAFENYKVSFMGPFLASYILQNAYKMLFRSGDDFLLFIDLMRLYSALVQKESESVYYTINDLDYTIDRNKDALVRIFKAAHSEFEMPDVYLELISKNYKFTSILSIIGFMSYISLY